MEGQQFEQTSMFEAGNDTQYRASEIKYDMAGNVDTHSGVVVLEVKFVSTGDMPAAEIVKALINGMTKKLFDGEVLTAVAKSKVKYDSK